MESPPVTLDYGRPSPPRWRTVGRVTLRAAVIVAVAAVAVWAGLHVWQVWGRYRDQRNYEAGLAALAAYTIPLGTVLLDPTAGPATYMKAYPRAVWRTLKIPNDPTVEKNLRLMGKFDSLSVYPLATRLQTPRGTAFVRGTIDTLSGRSNGEQSLIIVISEEYRTPGRFPTYRYQYRGALGSVRIIASPGRPPPVVLAGRPDASGPSWTLPLIVDGRTEWLRIDHTTRFPKVTASFGQMTPGRYPEELRY